MRMKNILKKKNLVLAALSVIGFFILHEQLSDIKGMIPFPGGLVILVTSYLWLEGLTYRGLVSFLLWVGSQGLASWLMDFFQFYNLTFYGVILCVISWIFVGLLRYYSLERDD